MMAHVYRTLHSLNEDPVLYNGTTDALQDALSALQAFLYPWLRHDLDALQRSFKDGRGIVLCVSDAYLRLAVSAIGAIRATGSTLPIEVFYHGDADLSPAGRQRLRRLTRGVVCRDVGKVFPHATLDFKGFAIKPFAMLAASFSEVILVCAGRMPHPSCAHMVLV